MLQADMNRECLVQSESARDAAVRERNATARAAYIEGFCAGKAKAFATVNHENPTTAWEKSEVRAALRGELGLAVRPVQSVAGIGRVIEFGPSDTKGYDWIMRDGQMRWNDLRHDDLLRRCPLGVPGDRLVGKETWAVVPYPAPGDKCRIFAGGVGITYKADWQGNPSAYRFISPATMPSWASRITLEVEGVRCGRFGELSHTDAKLCGLIDDGLGHFIPMQRFWNAKYAKRGLAWETNPFVWAVGVRGGWRDDATRSVGRTCVQVPVGR
jgi:hypothetical protein